MGQSAAEVAGEAGTAAVPPARSWRKLAWWAWVAAYVVAGVTLFFCYRRLSGTQAVTSDGAASALQAWDMLHGNPLLRGWTVSDVSFYTTELPEYVGVELIRGLGPDVVHVAAGFTYTLLVLLAGLLAKGRAKGREALVRVLIASGIMIAPQLRFGASIVLLGPDHTGTQVPLLVTWLVLDRAPTALVRAADHHGDAGVGTDRRQHHPARGDRPAGAGVLVAHRSGAGAP